MVERWEWRLVDREWKLSAVRRLRLQRAEQLSWKYQCIPYSSYSCEFDPSQLFIIVVGESKSVNMSIGYLPTRIHWDANLKYDLA